MSSYDAVMGANELGFGLACADEPGLTETNPVWDQLVDDLGPLYDTVVTEWTVLHSQGVIAAAAGLPC